MYYRYVANGPKITRAKFGVKMFLRVQDTAANVMYYAMGKSASFLRRESYLTPSLMMKIQIFFQNTNIFETKIGAKKKCINGM